MRRPKSLPILATLMVLTQCAPPAPPVPAPPPPAPAPPPALPPVNWRDAPLTPGGWSYRAEAMTSMAIFVTAANAPVFSVRCERRTRSISLNRSLPASPAAAVTIRVITTFGDGQWPAAVDPARPVLTASLAATDPFLDKLAYSLGRFMIEAPGTEPIILPAQPEVARVIEDCRSDGSMR